MPSLEPLYLLPHRLLMDQQPATPKHRPPDPVAIHTDLGRSKVTDILSLIQP